MTTQDKISVLMQDFLERDKDTFVRIRKTQRLGWEKTVEKGKALSSFILRNPTKADLIRKAYSFAKCMLAAMNIKKKVTIKLTGENSATDSNVVWVATRMFDDASLTPGQALDIFTGLTIHEGCHLKYTDFTPVIKDRTEAWLANLLEDERIEILCGDEAPGLANYLAFSKYYYFGNTQKVIEEKQEPIVKILNAILGIVRYPKCLKEEDLINYCDILLRVKEIINPFPTTQAEVNDAAKKIYELLKELIQNENSSERDKEDSNASNSDENKDRASEEELTEEQKTKILENILEDILSAEDSNEKMKCQSQDNISVEIQRNNNMLGRLLQCEIEEGSIENTMIYFPEEDKPEYQESYKRISRFIPAIRKVLQYGCGEKRTTNKGLRSGILDTGKIAEAFQGVETVYMRNSTKKAKELAVCILIDQSGSMFGNKIEAARDTAVLLTEALSSIQNITLYVYGHDSDGKNVNIYSYLEGNSGSKYSIGSTESFYSNIDSKAILETAHRVRMKCKNDVLFFVISDGQPCEDVRNVKNAVKKIERQGFNVMSIGIEADYNAKDMYDNHILLTDMSRLALDMGKMTRKLILKKQ